MKDRRIVVVRDPRYKHPVWKYPAGHKELGETPKECAARELSFETGVRVNLRDLELVVKEDREDHDFYLFLAQKCDMSGFKRRGDEGEDVNLMTASIILGHKDFMIRHRTLSRHVLEKIASS